MLHTTIALRIAYKLFSPFIDERVKQKIVLLSEGTCEELQLLFHPSQLEEKFGGAAKNVESFWPPYEDSKEYGEDKSRYEILKDPENFSISEEYPPSGFYKNQKSWYLKLEAKSKSTNNQTNSRGLTDIINILSKGQTASVNNNIVESKIEANKEIKRKKNKISKEVKQKKSVWGVGWTLF